MQRLFLYQTWWTPFFLNQRASSPSAASDPGIHPNHSAVSLLWSLRSPRGYCVAWEQEQELDRCSTADSLQVLRTQGSLDHLEELLDDACLSKDRLSLIRISRLSSLRLNNCLRISILKRISGSIRCRKCCPSALVYSLVQVVVDGPPWNRLREGRQYRFLIVNPSDPLLLIPEAMLSDSLNKLSLYIQRRICRHIKSFLVYRYIQ